MLISGAASIDTNTPDEMLRKEYLHGALAYTETDLPVNESDSDVPAFRIDKWPNVRHNACDECGRDHDVKGAIPICEKTSTESSDYRTCVRDRDKVEREVFIDSNGGSADINVSQNLTAGKTQFSREGTRDIPYTTRGTSQSQQRSRMNTPGWRKRSG
jgi:hypothetical protein